MDDGVPPRKRRVPLEQRRALQLLACSPFGAAEAIMLTHGFTRGTLAGLVRAGLAMAQHETIKADRRLVGASRSPRPAGGRSKADREHARQRRLVAINDRALFGIGRLLVPAAVRRETQRTAAGRGKIGGSNNHR
jgi:hypothetical protein